MSNSDTKLPWPQNVLHDALHKPATTESGETKPSCITYVGRDDIAQRIIDIVGDRRVPECELKLRVQAYLGTYAKLPTPPASTVTLDRADFDKAILRLERMRKALSPHAGIDNGMFDECAAIVALLRAAERRK